MSIDARCIASSARRKWRRMFLCRKMGVLRHENDVLSRGVLTGPGHSGAQLHGFLSYLVKCAVIDRPYTVFGYKGKQVRDNIHSHDLVNAFWHVCQAPRSGEVYNIGGGPTSNCSMLKPSPPSNG